MTHNRRASGSEHSYDRDIAARLRELRITKGISQQQLAEAAGITFQQIQKYEKAINRVSASRLVTLARALGKNPTYFLDDLA